MTMPETKTLRGTGLEVSQDGITWVDMQPDQAIGSFRYARSKAPPPPPPDPPPPPPCDECGGKRGHVPGCRVSMDAIRKDAAERYERRVNTLRSLIGCRLLSLKEDSYQVRLSFDSGRSLVVTSSGEYSLDTEVEDK